jgi:beta-mannosidase
VYVPAFERCIPPNVRIVDRTVDLTGVWRAHADEGELVKEFADPAFDERDWATVTLPHHWQFGPEFATENGPFLYRRTFTYARTRESRRSFLVYDGIFYYGDAWIDGDYLGTTEGYFIPHEFEVTQPLAARDDHVVALEVTCPPQRDRTAKRTITGVFGHWDAADPAFNPGGPWRPMRIVDTGRVRIANLRVLCAEALEERSRLTCTMTLDADEGPLDAVLRAHVADDRGNTLLDAFRVVTLATGSNQQSWTFTVEDAPRWWPRSLGEQPLCTVKFSVSIAGEMSD